MLMKCADLGHICTHLPTHLKWVAALEEEMFMQVRECVIGHAHTHTNTHTHNTISPHARTMPLVLQNTLVSQSHAVCVFV